MRCRHGGIAGDLGRGSGRGNGPRRPVRAALFLAALAAWGASAGGCSLSFPISGVKSDVATTGSVDRTVALLSPSPASPALDREDLRRARAAMVVALDPQGNGARAGWQNPQSGAHGGFAASAPPYADHDRVCRRFSGEVVPAGGSERRLTGSACREGDGTWQVLPPEDARA